MFVTNYECESDNTNVKVVVGNKYLAMKPARTLWCESYDVLFVETQILVG